MKHGTHPKAIARVQGGKDYPQICGNVRFFQHRDGLIVEAEIWGLPRTKTGFFAFHIHEGGSCTGEDFSDTGGHYNPDGTPHPDHRGDLPPLFSNQGKAYMKVFTDRLCIGEVMGKTVIIHSQPDDFYTQPSGNAGVKIACGVICRV